MEKQREVISDLKKRYVNYLLTRKSNREPVDIKLRDDIIQAKLQFGMSATAIAELIGMQSQVLNRWIRENRPANSAVAAKHGNTARYDIPTKCLAIKKALEDGKPLLDLAKEYNVAPATISHWKKQYQYVYKEYLDLPDGTMIMAKEEKMIYGLGNIKDYIELKTRQLENANQAIDLMQKGKMPQNIITKAIEYEDEISKELNILQQAEDIMSSEKKVE
jgi:transposase-like protein